MARAGTWKPAGRRAPAWIVGVFALGSVLAGCSVVSPAVPPGEPVPALVLSVDQVGLLSGVVTITATPVNFEPSSVTFRRSGDSTPLGTVTSAPFEVVFDTTTVVDGLHAFTATGADETYTVLRTDLFRVRNNPNVVIVYVDDLDETTTPYWDALPQTQALLADRGLTFSNSFVTSPSCCPARASVLTGRYPHNTGVFDDSPPDGGFQVFRSSGAEADTVATRLQGAGYATAFLGKYVNGYPNQPTWVAPGWDEWFALVNPYRGYDYEVNANGTIVHYGSDPADYQTDVLAARSTEFVDGTEADDDRPFFLFVSPTAPHWPIPPAPRHQPNPFGNDDVPTRPNFDEPDVSDKPTWLRDGVPPLSSQQLFAQLIDYTTRMGSLLAVDDLVASLVARLEANGELDDTVLVFTSDNGYSLGAHRLAGKGLPYEESLRVPLVLAGPGIEVGTDDRFVTNVDLAPTVLDLAGLDGSDVDGRSLVPLLEGGSPPWSDDFLVEYNGTYGGPTGNWHTFDDVQNHLALGDTVRPPTFRAIRSVQWLYVEWYAGDVHEYELYDMAADPYQLDNLVATPAGAQAHAATTAALQARLETLMACAGPSCRS